MATVSSCRPPGAKARSITASLWPRSVRPPVGSRTFQTSMAAVTLCTTASRCPSGLNDRLSSWPPGPKGTVPNTLPVAVSNRRTVKF